MKTTDRASLAEALKQTRPFTQIEQEAYLSIMRTAAELGHEVDQLFKRSGVTQPQYNVLRILQGASPEGLNRREIAERLVTPMPDVSRLLERMVQAGWIIRERRNEDRREVVTNLTPEGRSILLALEKPLKTLHRRQFRGIDHESLQTMLGLLAEVRGRN